METTIMDIERIRELARELNIDMVNQGVACLPQDIRKNMGSICRVNRAGGCELYHVRINHNRFHRSVFFETSADAGQHLNDTNMRENLPIKNKFTVFEDRVLVKLTQGKLLCG